MSQTEYRKIFEKALACFTEKGKTVEGVFDLLLRGGGTHEDHFYVENWSDLDLSLIVFKINENVLLQYRWLYNEIKEIFPYKLSLTLVTYLDFMSPSHHHGIKPIYYNELLKNSISLLQNKSSRKEIVESKMQQFDCLANIAYLTHDLKNRWLILDFNSNQALIEYLCHAAKRAKHIIRNSIFIMTGIINEEIDLNVFQQVFPKEKREFPERLKRYKLEFSEYAKNKDNKKHLQTEILYILSTLESIHEYLKETHSTESFEKQLYYITLKKKNINLTLDRYGFLE